MTDKVGVSVQGQGIRVRGHSKAKDNRAQVNGWMLAPEIRQRSAISSRPPLGPTTPESWKGSSKVNFPTKAIVFKSGERGYPRFGIIFPLEHSGVEAPSQVY